MFKKIILGFIIFLIFIMGFTVYGIYQLDSLVKQAIQGYGSEAVASKVTVGDVNVNLKEAKVLIRDLQVANPEGFTQAQALKAKQVEIFLDKDKLGTDLIMVRRVMVTQPVIVYEYQNKKDNLSILQKNAEAYAQRIQKDGSATPGDPKVAKTQSTRLIIQSVEIQKPELVLQDTRLADKPVQIDLPDIRLKQLDSEKGLSAAQLSAQLMESLFTESRRSISHHAPTVLFEAGEKLKEAESQIKSQGDRLLKELQGLFR
ncbi:MAG: hypothetical protein EBS31_05310 [Burkholderiaceae bacterium]|nr:hypothetical protein [Burkholderiaceae bacterium]